MALPWINKIDAFIQTDDDNKEILSQLTGVSTKNSDASVTVTAATSFRKLGLLSACY